jgi:hypothetical protein
MAQPDRIEWAIQAVPGVAICSRQELTRCEHWRHAFANERKDHRHYELVEDAIHPEFEYRYLPRTGDGGLGRSVVDYGSGRRCATLSEERVLRIRSEARAGVLPFFAC